MPVSEAPTVAPTRKSKVATLGDAAALIGDGSSLALGGIHLHNGPMALIRELVRGGREDLTLIPNVSVGMPAELLIAAGAVKRIYASYVGLEHHGLAPAFRKAGQEGTIEVHDIDEPGSVYAMRAAAASLPFMPFPPGHKAVDVTRLNPDDYKVTTDPFTGEDVVVVRPLMADFGLIHVPQADQFGNVQLEGAAVQDVIIAKSARHVIATAEKVVPVEVTKRAPEKTQIAGFFVDTVVHAPFGAHPTSSHGRYYGDEDHVEIYKELGPDRYIEEWVKACPTEAEWADKVGGARIVGLMEGMANNVL